MTFNRWKYSWLLIILLFVIPMFSVFIIPKFSIIRVSGHSMEDAIISGDYILVQNFSPLMLFPLNTFSANKCQIERGDIVVFNNSHLSNDLLVKRCAALSGDTLIRINSNFVFPLNPLFFPTQKSLYCIWINNIDTFLYYTENSQFSRYATVWKQDANIKLIELNLKQIEILGQQSFIDSVSLFESKHGGVLLKEIETNVDWLNFMLCSMKKVESKYFTNNVVQISDGYSIIFNSGKEVESLILKKGFVFLMGDNLLFSIDSRHFGPIPEENIIGKATLVLFNYHNGKFRWDRFLKKIE